MTVVGGHTAEELVRGLEAMLDTLVERGLYTLVHKAVFYLEDIRWYGRLY